MKKSLLFIAALAMIAFTSCKKEYTCTCYDYTEGTTYEKTDKGKDAADACDKASSLIPLVTCTPKE